MASFTERYHELTKYNPQTIDKLGRAHWEEQPPPFKELGSEERVDLKPYLKQVATSGEEGRWLVREGSLTSPDTLSQLLFFTLGITARLATHGGQLYLRAAPSAGGLYPTEVYVALRKKGEIDRGLYHYHSLESALVPVWKGDFWGDLKHHFLNHPAVEASELMILFTGVYARSAWRYKERAYRRILLDTGHALGNLLETCENKDLAACVLGGFLDTGLEELLFLSPKEEFPLLGIAISSEGGFETHDVGQNPSALPSEAVQHADRGDPMQVQQNQCERIRTLETARAPLPTKLALAPSEEEIGDPFKTIALRRSCRRFSGKSVSLEQMTGILSYGYRRYKRNHWTLAADYLQTYVLALNVGGLEKGIYTFDPTNVSLDLKQAGDFKAEAYYMCLGQDLAGDSSFVIVHATPLPELVKAFGDRGYRYACIDAGQIGERINLMALHLGAGSSGIGGYFDDQANEVLGLPLSSAILYITVVGDPDE